MQQLSRRANSLAHLDSKSQSPFLVSSGLATAPPPSAQAQRRGPAPLPEPAWARSPGARSPRAPQTSCSGFWRAGQSAAASSSQPPHNGVRRLGLGENTPLGGLIAAAAAAAGIAAFKWRCDGKKSLELWRPGLLGAGRSEGATLMISDDSIALWGRMGISPCSWCCKKSQASISQA